MKLKFKQDCLYTIYYAPFICLAAFLILCSLCANAQEKQDAKPEPQIQSVSISFERSGNKTADIYASLYLGASPQTGEIPMFVKGPSTSADEITLIPDVLYKGNFDLINIQKSGGACLEIGPVTTLAHRSPSGLLVPSFTLYETEKITITLNIKQPDGKRQLTPNPNPNSITFNVGRGGNFQGEVKVKEEIPYFFLSFLSVNGTLVVN